MLENTKLDWLHIPDYECIMASIQEVAKTLGVSERSLDPNGTICVITRPYETVMVNLHHQVRYGFVSYGKDPHRPLLDIFLRPCGKQEWEESKRSFTDALKNTMGPYWIWTGWSLWRERDTVFLEIRLCGRRVLLLESKPVITYQNSVY